MRDHTCNFNQSLDVQAARPVCAGKGRSFGRAHTNVSAFRCCDVPCKRVDLSSMSTALPPKSDQGPYFGLFSMERTSGGFHVERVCQCKPRPSLKRIHFAQHHHVAPDELVFALRDGPFTPLPIRKYDPFNSALDDLQTVKTLPLPVLPFWWP